VLAAGAEEDRRGLVDDVQEQLAFLAEPVQRDREWPSRITSTIPTSTWT
jgi:hypothetical protein